MTDPAFTHCGSRYDDPRCNPIAFLPVDPRDETNDGPPSRSSVESPTAPNLTPPAACLCAGLSEADKDDIAARVVALLGKKIAP